MTISINEKSSKTVVTCNTCGKETFSVDGVRSNRVAYAKAIETGWRWKNAATQIGPKCRETAAKASKPASKPAEPKKAKTTVVKRGKTQKAAGSKPNGATSFMGGQSIGKIAKSAKVEAAPAAE